MNWTLIRKDLRLMRPVTLGAVILAVVFYITLPSMAVFDAFKKLQESVYEGLSFWEKLTWSRTSITPAVSSACLVINACLLLWLPAMGGIAFAYERRERWADLLGTLPIARGDWVATKFASNLIWTVSYLFLNSAIYAINLIAQYLASNTGWQVYNPNNVYGPPGRWGGVPLMTYVESTLTFTSYGLALFGMAWLFSALLRSAVISACIPIAVVVVAFLMVVVVFNESPIKSVPSELQEVVIQFVLPLMVAAVTIPMGIAIQKLRATP